jgi:hypothetical protein
MSRSPDLRDLIGDEGSPEELARLERAHELLVAAGPPPEGGVPEPPRVGGQVVHLRSRRRWAELAAVAALVCVAVGAGYLVGNRGGGFESVVTLSMHGVPPTAAASATLDVGEADAAGNVPIEMRIAGLPRLPQGGWYELYLSKNGRPGASCGTFTAAGDTSVTLSVGYDLAAWHEAGVYDGWVITAHVPGDPKAARRVLLTT